MSRRRQLEHEVSLAQERIKKAPKDTPKEILKTWEQELVDLELEYSPGYLREWLRIKGIRLPQFISCVTFIIRRNWRYFVPLRLMF